MSRGAASPRTPSADQPRRGGRDGQERYHDTLLRTDALEYRLEEAYMGYQVTIPYTFRNTTGRTVYLQNCNGNVSPSLERQEGQEWVLFWQPVYDLCASAPIVINAEGTYRDSLRLRAGRMGSDVGPQFPSTQIEGVFRLLWIQAAWRTGSGSFEPLPRELNSSNPFVLREP